MFQLGSHRVVPIPDCSVQHPLINRVVAVVRRALVDANVTPYSEVPHVGLARYLQVVVERSSQSAQVVLVANSPTAEPLAACLDLIRDRLGDELHSLWFNAHCERSNTILGPDFVNWCGPASVIESFRWSGSALSTGRIWPEQPRHRRSASSSTCVPRCRRTRAWPSSTPGVGAIGLSLLPRARAIRMNEVSPHSLQGMALGIAALDTADRARVEVVPGLAGAAIAVASGADVVIADPPRKGLDRDLLEYLGQQPPELFLYVSCGLDSFIEDTARLTSGGRLRLSGLTAFNLMPFTEHVETVARFERA